MMHIDYQKFILKAVYEKELAYLHGQLTTNTLWDQCLTQINTQLRYCPPTQAPEEKARNVLRAIAKSELFANGAPHDQDAVKKLLLVTCYHDSIDHLSKDLSTNQHFVDAVNEAYRYCFSSLRAKY
jgi:hypothetical protein